MLDVGQHPWQGGIGTVPAPDSFISQRRIFAELEMSHQVIYNVPRYAYFPGLFGQNKLASDAVRAGGGKCLEELCSYRS